MAIFRPGERHRYHNILRKRRGKRALVALLSLTAMVDMFTVLVIFLLQNFSGEQQMLQLHKDIELPQARSIKELKPAFVVTVSNKEILVDDTVVANTDEIKTQQDWMIQNLHAKIEESLAKAKADFENKLQNRIRDVVQAARSEPEEDPNSWNKITIQADRNIDILTVKKVMYTVTEAGGGEINFAVLKEPENTTN
ncbi:MAG TPA: biopolymer transporter ExbD [Pseudobdellovibrionaceae bacterium]|nr:biopolymer transporter ExbD [Pseudobdellovibrionaceae bacterium]